MIDLNNKTIIITGASSGIGAATALACAEAGMHLLLNARGEDRLKEVARRAAGFGRRVELVFGDVTDPGLNARLLDTAQERLGGFYAVFANAGYGFKRSNHETDDATLRRIWEVNFFAANDLLCQAARRLIAARQKGHLLMCSSAIAHFTIADFSAYSATKAAQNHVCRAMNLELHRQHGIAVSSVHPVRTRTDFFRVASEHEHQPFNEEKTFGQGPGLLTQRPEQVADAIVRCLRKPRPEVWTSRWFRYGIAIMVMSPRLLDWVARSQLVDPHPMKK